MVRAVSAQRREIQVRSPEPIRCPCRREREPFSGLSPWFSRPPS